MSTERSKSYTLDEYDRNARLKPALLAVLPIGLLIVGQGLRYSVVVGLFAGPLTAIGFAFVLAEFGRDWGRAKQGYLFSLWGGKPTTAKLRHRDMGLNPYTRARYHEIASKLIRKTLPSVVEEEADPQAADQMYESVGDCLVEQTRDKNTFPLVFKELVSYGFRRNLWGVKPFGVSLALSCVVLQFMILNFQRSIDPAQFLMTLSNIVLVLCWTLVVRPSWVRVAAEAYAERLLASCVTIETPLDEKFKR
jgi:hypothetical protein